MKTSSLIRTVFLAAALTSALAACGRQSNNKTKIGKATEHHGKTTEATPTMPETAVAQDAQSACAPAFTDFSIAENEREVKFEDLANEDMLQLGEQFAGKKVVFKLKSTTLWSSESTTGNASTAEQMSGTFDMSTKTGEVTCHTKAAKSFGFSFISAVDLAEKKAIEATNFELLHQDGKVAAQMSSEELSKDISQPTEAISYDVEKEPTSAQSVYVRVGEDTLIKRTERITVVDKSSITQKIVATYVAEIVDDQATTASDETTTADDSSTETSSDADEAVTTTSADGSES